IGDSFFDSWVKQSRLKTILIAVSATHAERMTGSHHSGSRCPTFVDSLSQSHVVKLSRCADIAHCSESSHQRCARVLHAENRRKRFEIPDRRIFTCRITKHASDQMSMSVDESRHERHVAEIDYSGI